MHMVGHDRRIRVSSAMGQTSDGHNGNIFGKANSSQPLGPHLKTCGSVADLNVRFEAALQCHLDVILADHLSLGGRVVLCWRQKGRTFQDLQGTSEALPGSMLWAADAGASGLSSGTSGNVLMGGVA